MIEHEWIYPGDFTLESGAVIRNPKLVYHTAGKRKDSEDNVVLAFHALTANSNVLDWWEGLFGAGELFCPETHFILCINVLGSCYGSTEPQDLNFPRFTVRDVVRLQLELVNDLDISNISVLIGGSFGGSQALEFNLMYPGNIGHLITIAATAQESAWGIAIHAAQRLALQADSSFGTIEGGKAGLKAARAIGMLTYRTAQSFIDTQSDIVAHWPDRKAASYIHYQGEKLVKRFTPLSYYYLTLCLDSHDLGRDRGGLDAALASITTKTLIIGIDTDQLVPAHLQEAMARKMPHAQYQTLTSSFGHDGFLIETPAITRIIHTFLNTDS